MCAVLFWIAIEKIIDGFSYQYAGPDEDATIIIRENEWANSVGVRFRAPLKDLDSYIKYINERRLEELENLETLYLEGNNSIPNLKFLDKLKNLQVFGFDVNVEDGDLSPCLRLPTVWCYQGRRHYNLKNKDLPKQPYRGE